ncbi:MAG: type VII secretion-associated serine protease mycosin [Mycobacteriales bacterium]
MTGRPAFTAVLAALAWSAVFACGDAAAYANPPKTTPCQLPGTSAYTGRPWAQQRLDFERVWPLTTGAGVTVAVVDTGVDIHQPLLGGHAVAGVDVVNGGTATLDCVGHGTLLAGLIAAPQAPGGGFAGVAPGATILPVIQTDTVASGTAADLAKGINAAVDHGARVINVSITTPRPTGDLAGAVRRALDRGVVVVAAAGNDFQQGNAPEYPAAYPGVISVGALSHSGQPTDFSSSGTPVSVIAPGDEIVGPGAGGDGFVGKQQGTSYATAFVSGVAALVQAYRPGLTPAQVAHRIEATADHAATAVPDARWGWGVVNPYAAVTAVLPEESGAGPAASPASSVSPYDPPPADHTTAAAALALGGAGAVLAVLVPMTAVTVRRIRRPGTTVAAGTEVRSDD